MCNEIWYYGEFDFFYDYCRHLRYRFKSEWYRHWYYGGVANIFFSEHYNVRLMFINQGEPRKDDYLDFYLGKEKKSIKEIIDN